MAEIMDPEAPAVAVRAEPLVGERRADMAETLVAELLAPMVELPAGGILVREISAAGIIDNMPECAEIRSIIE